VVIRGHSWSFIVIRRHSWSFVVIRLCHSSSFVAFVIVIVIVIVVVVNHEQGKH
jgi:hypothetical protein